MKMVHCSAEPSALHIELLCAGVVACLGQTTLILHKQKRLMEKEYNFVGMEYILLV